MWHLFDLYCKTNIIYNFLNLLNDDLLNFFFFLHFLKRTHMRGPWWWMERAPHLYLLTCGKIRYCILKHCLNLLHDVYIKAILIEQRKKKKKTCVVCAMCHIVRSDQISGWDMLGIIFCDSVTALGTLAFALPNKTNSFIAEQYYDN